MEAPEIRAEFIDFREGVGRTFVQELANKVEAIERRAKAIRAIYWTLAERMPLDLFSYIREASECFIYARYLGTIVLASCAVELILNRDSRTVQVTPGSIIKWQTLSNKLLRSAQKKELPVHSLMSAGESLTGKDIRFVQRRNEVGHGRIEHLIKTISDYDPGAEAEAFDQARKADQFVVDWFNTAPDVQGGRIRNYRWGLPDRGSHRMSGEANHD